MELPAIDTTVILRKKDFIGKKPHVDVFVTVKKILTKSVLCQLNGSEKQAYIPSKWFTTKASDLTAQPPIVSLPTWYNIICNDELDAVYPSELELAGRLDSEETTKKNIPMETPTSSAPIFKSTVKETAPLIYSKIINVMKAIKAIGKNQTAGDKDFAFRGIDDIVNALSPLFQAEEIFISADVLSHQTNAVGKTVVSVKFSFFTSDGSSVSSTVTGEGFDKSEHGTAKAISHAFKITLEKMFMIPTSSDLEWLSQKQFQQALLRINKGEDLLEKLKEQYRIKTVHLNMLEEATKKKSKK